MKPGLPNSTVLSLALAFAVALTMAGCSADRDDDPGFADATTSPADQAAVLDQPGEDIPPATAPPGTVMPGELPQATDPAPAKARFDGYANVDFGMDTEQVRQLWDAELSGNPAEGESCFHLNPVGQPSIAYFALMFVDGRFARYSVANDEMVAPGGGQHGMDRKQIEQLYSGRIEQTPHKYVPDGQYLRIKNPEGGDGVLVFATDADGIVTEWRVGVPPAVDYVEGCA
ncbi:lectin [Lysobacter sp. A289]